MPNKPKPAADDFGPEPENKPAGDGQPERMTGLQQSLDVVGELAQLHIGQQWTKGAADIGVTRSSSRSSANDRNVPPASPADGP